MNTEELIDEVLRALPLQRAPATLESRVRVELQRRGAQPWWHRGFSHWPNGGRAAFVAMCGAIIAITGREGWWTVLVRELGEAGTAALSWMHPAVVVVVSAGEVAGLLIRVIPPTWLYGGLAAGIALYAVLFGLGAAAYHALRIQPYPAGDQP